MRRCCSCSVSSAIFFERECCPRRARQRITEVRRSSVLFIHNETVDGLLSMKDCIEIQEEAFKAMEHGGAIHRPRIDMYTPTERSDGYYRWGTMEGWYDGVFAIRMKSDVITWPKTGNGS